MHRVSFVCMHACRRVFMRVCACVQMCVRACVCVRVRVRAYMCACVHVCMCHRRSARFAMTASDETSAGEPYTCRPPL